MATPDFITQLRKHIGHAPLWLPGVTTVILREAPAAGTEAPGTSTEAPAAGTEQPHRPQGLSKIQPCLEVLLVRRSDNGQWTPVTGISDPNEDPHTTAIREAKEETGLDIRIEGLLGTGAVGPVTYSNGDIASFLDVALRASIVGSDIPIIGDEESSAVSWHPVADLPRMKPRFHMLIGLAVAHFASQSPGTPGFTPIIGYKC